MRKITVTNAAKTPEQVNLYSAFKIDAINKNFVIISKGESAGEGLNKIYISEVVENADGIFDMVSIADENVWSSVKNAMKDMVSNERVNYIEVGSELKYSTDLGRPAAIDDLTMKGIDKVEELKQEEIVEEIKSEEPEIVTTEPETIVEENSAADFKVPELEEKEENTTSPLNEIKLEDVAVSSVGNEIKNDFNNNESTENDINKDIEEAKKVADVQSEESDEEIVPETIKEEPVEQIESEDLPTIEQQEEVEELPIENLEEDIIDEVELKTPDVPDYSISDFKEELPTIEKDEHVEEDLNLNALDVVEPSKPIVESEGIPAEDEYASNMDYVPESETFDTSNTLQEENLLDDVEKSENNYLYAQNVENDPTLQSMKNAMDEYSRVKSEYSILERKYYHLQNDLEEAKKDKILAEEEREQLKEELNITKRSCDIYKNQKEIEEQKYLQFQNKYNDEKRSWEQKNQEFAVKQGEIDLKESENESLRLQISQIQQKNASVDTIIQDKDKKLELTNQQLELLRVEKETSEAKVKEAAIEMQEKDRQVEESKKIAAEATGKISELHQQLEDLKMKHNQEVDNLKVEYNKKIEEVQNKLQIAQNQVNTLQHENAELVAVNNQANKKVSEYQITAQQAKDQLEVVRKSAQEEILAEQRRSAEKVEQIKQDANSQFEAFKTSAATSKVVAETTPNQQEQLVEQKVAQVNPNGDLIAGVKPVGQVNDITSPLNEATLDSLITDTNDGGMQRTKRPL